MDGNTGNLSVGDTKLTEFKFDYQWGGVDTPFTKMKRWAQKQKNPIVQHLALGLIEWLWIRWVDGRVEMEMTSVDQQAEEIKEEWAQQEDDLWVTESSPSEVKGLDNISISFKPSEPPPPST